MQTGTCKGCGKKEILEFGFCSDTCYYEFNSRDDALVLHLVGPEEDIEFIDYRSPRQRKLMHRTKKKRLAFRP